MSDEQPEPLAIVVNGGRGYNDRESLYAHLDRLRDECGNLAVVIHGAARGDDSLAAAWAVERDVPQESFPAEWGRFGASAGPIRNRRMLERAKEWTRHGLVSFPGGRGTRGTRAIATEMGVPVWLPAGR